MGKFDTYKLDLKHIPIGTHSYEYELGNDFFKNIDGEEFQRGKVSVRLTLVRKEEKTFLLSFDIQGVIQIPCDRCLDSMDYEVTTQEKMTVKLGEAYDEINDNTIIIPESEGELNIAWFLYEYIALTIPLKHVHPSGKCNKSMTAKLHKHIARSSEDETDGEMETLDGFMEEEVETEDTTDPRWDALKELKDNI